MSNPARLLLPALVLLAANLSFAPSSYSFRQSSVEPPEPSREFRGAWVATVANIDWPSRPGLTTEQQQAEMTAILDTAQRLHLNAIVLQVRPSCDALYKSRLEPWSEYLTGRMGEPPSPEYDPLKFAIDEAHSRGIELHAWFNPYRARQAEARSPVSDDHISVKHPDLVRTYGKSLWLDPSEKKVQDHSVDVIMDVVKRYDIDGVHLDDYFYPYKEKGADGRILDFPDDESWEKYQRSNGNLSRDDWRREQVNRFIEKLYKEIKRKKKWVKFGISPFGIWRPGTPPTVKGFDAYQEIYADSRLWLNEGWLDYWSPQLYWKQDQAGQRYSDLLHWWVSQNTRSRHVWPGNYTSRVSDGSWQPDEIVRQIDITRREQGAGGNLHFSMKSLMQPRTGLAQTLESGSYAEPALVPASPWLSKERLGKPKLSIQKDPKSGETNLVWKPMGGKIWLWLVQVKRRTAWRTTVLPSKESIHNIADWIYGSRGAVVAVTPVDRCGNLGPSAVIEVDNGSSDTVRPDDGLGVPLGTDDTRNGGRRNTSRDPDPATSGDSGGRGAPRFPVPSEGPAGSRRDDAPPVPSPLDGSGRRKRP